VKKRFIRYGLLLITLLLAVSLGTPFAYAIALPTEHQILQVEAYRSVLELEDTLYLINYNLEYGASPTEPISDTYLFCLRVTATGALLGATTAYGYFDGGYDRGIATIYFNAADAPAWNGAYTLYFDGNPALEWGAGDDPPSTSSTSIDWFDEGSVADAQTRLTTRLRTIATLLETDWGPPTDLIEDSAGGKVLTATGEEYFTNSIINLRSMCPNLFYQQMTAVEFEHDILVADRLSAGEDGTVNVWGNNWVAQTFIPSERYDITGVNILVSRTGNPGNLTVSLRATAAGAPSGGDLTSGFVDGDAVTTDSDGEWVAIAFTDDYTLTAATSYAICVRSAGVNANNRINWFVDTGNGYANGSEYTNAAAGVGAWNVVAANDMLFEILARGGMTPRAGRIEGRLYGTIFDISQWAANWGISTMWLNTVLWVAMMFVLCWAMALAANSWDATMLLIAGCTAIGWRAGFVDTIFMALLMAVMAIGVIYAAFWKKSY